MPQATRSDDHRTYRCYLRGPDGIRELSPCGPGARMKLFLGALAVNEAWSRNAMAAPWPPGIFEVLQARYAAVCSDFDGDDVEADLIA